MAEWVEKSLGEVTSYIAKGIPPQYTDKYSENVIYVLNQKCNRDYSVSYEQARLHDLSKKKIAEEKMLKSGDVLINSTGEGTAGRVAQLWNIPSQTTVDGHMIILRPTSEVDTLYYGYAIKAQQFMIESLAEGSTGQTEINRKRLQEEITISYPKDKKKQHSIAKILEEIDKKIEVNNQINRNLSEQAKALFEEELLKFDSVPEGWKKGSLSDIADYLNGLAMQKFRPGDDEKGLPVLKIKELRQGSCDANSELCSLNIKPEYIIHDGDVIFSWSGSLLVDFWCGGECGLNQHLFKVTSKKYDKWFYYAWTLYHLDRFIAVAADKATTMGHIKREELSKAEVLIPDSDSYKRIGEVLGPLYDMIISNRVENRRLATLRDELLPMLMSGKMDVSEVEL